MAKNLGCALYFQIARVVYVEKYPCLKMNCRFMIWRIFGIIRVYGG
jgi:hypothetical protein